MVLAKETRVNRSHFARSSSPNALWHLRLTAIAISLALTSVAEPLSAATGTSCSGPTCSAPNHDQAETIFARIERQYPQFFSSPAATQTVQVDGDTVYFRTYSNPLSTALGTYRGGLWYASGGVWTRYSNLDVANQQFCGGTCWGIRRFKGEVWADNWFALYVDQAKVAEDSVPITTERSFNSESFYFDAEYPFELNFIIKDYKQDDTGLEYIGTARQQIGDGGFIMQVTDMASGKIVAFSDAATRCLVIHKAPLNPSCAKDSNPFLTCGSRIDPEPDGWKAPGYDTSAWQKATLYSEAQVGVKEGYFDIAWNTAARLIWTSDLKLDNTLLCKVSVTAPE